MSDPTNGDSTNPELPIDPPVGDSPKAAPTPETAAETVEKAAAKAKAGKGSSDYGAKDITILEGLEHVRKRPGMYIGSTGITGLHHLVWEVVDNGVDEAMAGYANKIDVTITADGGIQVTDNGRGIPVDAHPDPKMKGRSAAEIVLSVLNAGGKFGGDGYKVSGGLHGVGVSVVNALSSRLVATIDRDGNRYECEFHNGGKLKRKLEVIGKAPRGRTGTSITFWPDATIFEEIEFRFETLLERFRMMAFLNAGLEIVLTDDRPHKDKDGDGKPDSVTFKFNDGLKDFVKHLNATKEPLFPKVVSYSAVAEDGIGEAEVAIQWNTGYYEGVHSFANGISTIEGGTHVEGFRSALTTVINKYAREGKQPALKEKDENFAGEDIREGITAIISVKLRDPQFEGQTKGKLGNTSMRTLVQKATNEKLAEWFEENPKEANRIVAKAKAAQTARLAARSARDLVRRKTGLGGGGLPGKLRDCTSKSPAECELFIVEGDSALGSAQKARDPRIQAILPIRGKILNVERARIDKMLKNLEIQALISAIGAGVGDEFDPLKVRYHKIVALCDADVDGAHIRTLLLTFFFRQMRPMVEAGFCYIAQPPLFSVVVGKEKQYLKDDAAKNAFVAQHPNKKYDFNRLKGLGEMDWEELKDTTLDATKRTLLQVTLEEASIADEIVSTLMGDDVESRKQFIVQNANDVRFLDI
jgi:DNA gyrase subunit B